MSLESEFFGRYRPAFEKLESCGFSKTEAGYIYEADFLQRQFRARVEISPRGQVSGQVIDLDTEEEYLPIRAQGSTGGFVGSVREAYLEILSLMREACFVPVDFIYDQANRITGMIGERFGSRPEFPWEKYPGNGTFKCRENDKWFAAILTVAYEKLEAGRGEQIAEVINLKADPDRIPQLIQAAGVYPAWHMNKKHWISVLLDDTVSDEEIMKLVEESHDLVARKAAGAPVTAEAWIIPSNPRIYDIDAGFEAGGGAIEWHQHNRIRAGDEVYIYSAAPNSAIMYRCLVEAADLGYHGMLAESKGYERSMRIRLIEKYPKERFPLSFMKANGGSAVRSARRMPARLLDAMRRKELE